MKAIAAFFALSIALLFLGCADMRPVDQSKLTFDTVFTVQGMKKDAIYDGIKAWTVANVRSATEVVEYEKDKATLNMGSFGKVQLSDRKVLNSTAKPPIGYEDKAQGAIVANGIMNYPCPGGCFAKGDWRVLFTMKTDVKDEKYRITFSNLMVAWPYSENGGYPIEVNLGRPLQSEGELTDIRKGFETLEGNLNTALGNKTNSNW